MASKDAKGEGGKRRRYYNAAAAKVSQRSDPRPPLSPPPFSLDNKKAESGAHTCALHGLPCGARGSETSGTPERRRPHTHVALVLSLSPALSSTQSDASARCTRGAGEGNVRGSCLYFTTALAR